MSSHFRFPDEIVRHMKAATDDIVSLLGADGGSIWLHDGHGWFRPAAVRGLVVEFSKHRAHKIPFVNPGTGTTPSEEHMPWVVDIEHVENNELDDDTIAACRRAGIRSFWLHSMMAGDELTGNLSVVFRDARTPTERDVAFLRSLSKQVGVALTQERALTDARNRETALELLGDLSRLIVSSNDPRQVLRAVANNAHRLVGASSTRIALREEDGSLVAAAATRGHWRSFKGVRVAPDEDPSLSQLALREGTQVCDDATQDPRTARWLIERFGTLAMVIVPMIAAGEAVGVMVVDDRVSTRSFAADEVRHLEMIANVAAVTIRRARVLEHLRRRERELESLSDRLVHAQERERRRIAGQLEELVGRRLHGVRDDMLGVREILGNGAEPGPGQLQSALGRCATIRDEVQTIVAATRRMSASLHPGILDDLGLVPALRWYCGEVSRDAQLEVALDAPDKIEVAPEVMRTVYRVAQESISNVVRHARASTCRVELDRQDGYVLLSVTDDGKGFDVSARRRRGRFGIGLLGMGERARHLGGVLDVHSEVGGGTRVDLRLPTSTSG